MRWSLLIGRFWGTEIRLHASMLLLIPYTLLVFRPQGLVDSIRLLLLISAIFACVALHEMGHTLAARAFGIHVNSIVLWPLGGFANLSRRPQNVLHDIIISAAGPLTNLLVFSLLVTLMLIERLLWGFSTNSGLSRLLWEWQVFPVLAGLVAANLSLAVFNLIPVFPLDGGHIARNLLKVAFGEKLADTLMIFFSLPLALALTLVGIFTADVLIILTGLLLLLGSSTLNARMSNALLLAVLYVIDRGNYYLRRVDYDPAVAFYTKAIERNPNKPGPYINRAVTYMNLMELQKARADIERALVLDANNVMGLALRGELFALDGRFEDALASMNQAIQVKPGWAIAYLDRGGIYQEMGDLQTAQKDMDHGIELGNSASIGYILRSILRYQMGDIEGSRSDGNQAMRYAPHWMLNFPEIFLSSFQGHLHWVMDYYNRAVERMPNAYQAYQGRADACRVNERFDWAVEDYTRAIKLAPRQAALYIGRGQSYTALGRNDLALEDFRQAVKVADRSHLRRQAECLIDSLSGSA